MVHAHAPARIHHVVIKTTMIEIAMREQLNRVMYARYNLTFLTKACFIIIGSSSARPSSSIS